MNFGDIATEVSENLGRSTVSAADRKLVNQALNDLTSEILFPEMRAYQAVVVSASTSQLTADFHKFHKDEDGFVLRSDSGNVYEVDESEILRLDPDLSDTGTPTRCTIRSTITLLVHPYPTSAITFYYLYYKLWTELATDGTADSTEHGLGVKSDQAIMARATRLGIANRNDPMYRLWLARDADESKRLITRLRKVSGPAVALPDMHMVSVPKRDY